ncbi:hypothetical protein KY386_01460 [Candidatus Parcubacteria bacterium]|nr:hypothetical protein [Candidatus Parcubacteria bacterium]
MTVHANWIECNQALSQSQYVCRCGWRSSVRGEGWYPDIAQAWEDHLVKVRARLDGKLARLADLLFDIAAIQFGAFRLKLHETQPDAPLSPIFLNLRTPDNPKPGPLTPPVLALIGEVLDVHLLESGISYFRRVTGLPKAGDPLADALMARLLSRSWPVTQLRLGKQESGGKRQITGVEEGDFEEGDTVLLIDDLITQADSKLEAITALEAQGLVVKDVLVLVDRGQGGREQLMTADYQLHSVYSLDDLLNHYVATGKIDSSKALEVDAYLSANVLR